MKPFFELFSFWPLRAAFLRWQAKEGRLAAARQHLATEYQAAQRQAEELQIEPDQGILRAARLRLDRSFEPPWLMAKDRLQRAFARLGQGFLRRVPSLLDVELSQYVAKVEKICQGQSELVARLRLSRAMLMIFGRTPEFSTPHFFRLALISPESAWLVFHLRQKRLGNRRVFS